MMAVYYFDASAVVKYYVTEPAAIPAARFKVLYDPISSSFQQPVARPCPAFKTSFSDRAAQNPC